MTIKQSGIRDFIYLDIERVRSFLAQLSEGLTSERVMEKEREVGGKGSLEGGLPALMKAQAETDYHFRKSQTETKSLHDFIFEEFLDALKKKDAIHQLPDKNFQWQSNSFKDGMFVLVSGRVKIVDYQNVIQSLQNFPNIASLTEKIASRTQVDTQGTQTKNDKKQQTSTIRKLSEQVKSMPLKDISQFTDQFLGELVRIKVYPFKTTTDVFVSSADRNFFRYSPATLTALYGMIIDANWKCLLQVNIGGQYLPVNPEASESTKFEELIENLADHFSTFNSFMQGVQFPYVAATPIALYRDI